MTAFAIVGVFILGIIVGVGLLQFCMMIAFANHHMRMHIFKSWYQAHPYEYLEASGEEFKR